VSKTLHEGRHGHQLVGSTPVRLTNIDLTLYDGVLLRCPGTTDPTPNLAPVWVGFDASVTADSGPSGGMPIVPGAAMTIGIKDARNVWVVSSQEDQDIAYLVQ